MTTAVYARISLAPHGTETGVDNQVDVGCELCARSGWDKPQTYTDNDFSATYGAPRPEYERLLAAIEAGLITRVIVFHLSRLWRNRTERATGIDLMRRHRVSIVCVRGPSLDMSTASGRAMVGLLGEFDTMEVEIKSERQLLASEARARAGLPHVGGHRPFGYERGGIAVIEKEAQAIREACESVLTGVHLTAIAREWNAAGLRTGRSGKTWTDTSVRTVLTNPRIAGIRAHHKAEVAPGVWAAIVPEATYRAVVAYLAHPSRHTGGSGYAGIRLLTGIGLCGVPGCGLTVHGGGAQGHGGPKYRCPSQRHLSRQTGPVDDWVIEHVVARLSREDAHDLLIDRARSDVAELTGRAVALRARIAATRREFAADDTMSPAELREILAEQRGRLAKVEATMADAGRVDLLGPLVGAEDVRASWEAYGRPRQRLVIDTLVVVRIWPPGRGARRFDPATIEIIPKL